MADAWQPEQYQRFRDERAPPFHDLAALVEREPGMRVLDLGCGTGELTAWLHGTLGAQHTRGIDRSEAMLAKARAHATTGLDFVLGDIATLVVDDPVNLVSPTPRCTGSTITRRSSPACAICCDRAGRSRCRCRPTRITRRTGWPRRWPPKRRMRGCWVDPCGRPRC